MEFFTKRNCDDILEVEMQQLHILITKSWEAEMKNIIMAK